MKKLFLALLIILSLVAFTVYMAIGIYSYNPNMAKAFISVCVFFGGCLLWQITGE